MARLGKTINQVLRIYKARVDVFANKAPGALVVYINPHRASDDRMINYVVTRVQIENLAIRKKAMSDYLLAACTDWNLIIPASGQVEAVEEEPCPICETTGKVELEPARDEQVTERRIKKDYVPTAQDVTGVQENGAAMLPAEAYEHVFTGEVIHHEATYDDCPLCYGAGMIPVERQPEGSSEVAPGIHTVAEGADDVDPDAEEQATFEAALATDGVITEDNGQPYQVIEPGGEGAGAMTVDEAANVVDNRVFVGAPMPITRKNIEALGLYYMAQVIQAIFASFRTGEGGGSTSSTA